MRQQPPLGGNREYAQYRSVTMIRTFGGWGTTLTGRLVARPIYELREDGEKEKSWIPVSPATARMWAMEQRAARFDQRTANKKRGAIKRIGSSILRFARSG
jgi:hypothetical protein